MNIKPLFLCCTALAALVPLAQARDTSFTAVATTPIDDFENVGSRFILQTGLGPIVNLGVGYGQSAPQEEDTVGSFLARLSSSFDFGTSSRLYPFVGLDQELDSDDNELTVFGGFGIEQGWFNHVGGVMEGRYQADQEDAWHLQLGLRYWPAGRRPNVNVAPVLPTPAPAPVVQAPAEPAPVEPVVQAPVEPVVEAPVKAQAPEPSRPEPKLLCCLAWIDGAYVEDVISEDALLSGVYLHLGYYHRVSSIQNYRALVADRVWSDDLIIFYDEHQRGFHVMIGPYRSKADATKHHWALRKSGLDSYLYWVPERWPEPYHEHHYFRYYR